MYDLNTGAIYAFKTGADIRLTVGKHEVVINGETRSLDVPPRVERGTTYVPLRVLSEGLGAYVAWVPDKQLVSIRYNAPSTAAIPSATSLSVPSIVASAAPPSPAASAPSPTPSTPARSSYSRFVAVDLNVKPAVSNEFDAGKNGNTTQRIRGAFEYRLGPRGGKSFAEIEYRRWSYPHVTNATDIENGTLCSAAAGPAPSVGDPGCVTTIGGRTSAFVNSTQLSESELEFRNGFIALGGHTYVATATGTQSNSYGYPRLRARFGVGLERLPDLSRPFTEYASIYYFPELGGSYSSLNVGDVRLCYKRLSYEGGLALTIPKTALFLEVGAMSERYIGKENASSNVSRKALNLGFGVHF